MSPRRAVDPARVPPGQGVTPAWPVLHFGDVPRIDPARFRLRVHGAVEEPLELALDELAGLPRARRTADFHCVTGWSRLAIEWEGVALDELLRRARPLEGARSVRFADGRGYDTCLPLALARADALLADRADGAPLAAEHGGPLRAVVPSRYGWKSCKWLAEVELLREHELGFWEARGYHDGADPWREERLV